MTTQFKEGKKDLNGSVPKEDTQMAIKFIKICSPALSNYFLFLWIYLSCTLQINDLIPYVVFCIWFSPLSIMFLRFIYVQHVSMVCSFLLPNCISWSRSLNVTFPFISCWLYLDCFQLLVMMNKAGGNNCIHVFVWIYAFHFSWAGHMVSLCLMF